MAIGMKLDLLLFLLNSDTLEYISFWMAAAQIIGLCVGSSMDRLAFSIARLSKIP
jgi:hypothetical protein